MVNKEEFAAIHTDFIESQEFIELAHDFRSSMDFRCHHNAYLVAAFLQRRGHEGLPCVTGYYQCREPTKRVHHTWVKLVRDGKTAAIFEFDPRQLHEQGGYEDDLMPSGHVPEFSMQLTPIVSIVDPDLVDLSEEARKSPWVVPSNKVLLRYVEDDGLVPRIDFAELDELAVEALEVFDSFREFRNENARE